MITPDVNMTNTKRKPQTPVRSTRLVGHRVMSDLECSEAMARAAEMRSKLIEPLPHHRMAAKNQQSTSAAPLDGLVSQYPDQSPSCASAAMPESGHESSETSKTTPLPGSSSSTLPTKPNGRKLYLNALGVWLQACVSYLYQLANRLVWTFCRSEYVRQVQRQARSMSSVESCVCAAMQRQN